MRRTESLLPLPRHTYAARLTIFASKRPVLRPPSYPSQIHLFTSSLSKCAMQGSETTDPLFHPVLLTVHHTRNYSLSIPPFGAVE